MKFCAYWIVVVVSLTLTGSAYSQKDCLIQNACSCSMLDGSGTIDLTSLGNTDGTPIFQDYKEESTGYFYSYSPCGSFDEVDCHNAAACMLSQDKSQSQQIGDSGKVGFKYDDDSGNVIAAYTSGSSSFIKLTTVNLVCDQSACLNATFTTQGEIGFNQFEMTLNTICACPGMCTASGPISCSNADLPTPLPPVLWFNDLQLERYDIYERDQCIGSIDIALCQLEDVSRHIYIV